MDHISDNVEKLVNDIVEGWDLDDLKQYAINNMTNHYMENEDEFHEEWSDFYDEELDKSS